MFTFTVTVEDWGRLKDASFAKEASLHSRLQESVAAKKRSPVAKEEHKQTLSVVANALYCHNSLAISREELITSWKRVQTSVVSK